MSLADIRANHKPIIEKLQRALEESKLLKYSELKDGLNISDSQFCRDLDYLKKEKVINKFILDGKTYYSIGVFGEAICYSDKVQSNFFYAVIGFWEIIREEWIDNARQGINERS